MRCQCDPIQEWRGRFMRQAEILANALVTLPAPMIGMLIACDGGRRGWRAASNYLTPMYVETFSDTRRVFSVLRRELSEGGL